MCLLQTAQGMKERESRRERDETGKPDVQGSCHIAESGNSNVKTGFFPGKIQSTMGIEPGTFSFVGVTPTLPPLP